MNTTDPKNSTNQAFDKIAESVTYGNLGLFIGAGMPMAIMNSEDELIALSWPQLLHKCANEFGVDFKKINLPGNSYPDIASKLSNLIAKKKKISKTDAIKQLKQVIANLTSLYPDSKLRIQYREYFDVLNPHWIITTNYDTVIESILTGRGHSLAPEDQLIAPMNKIPVYHLHGIRTNPDSIIITQEDYVELFRPNQYRQQKLPLILKESVTVLIGYGLGDFNVMTAVDWSKNVYENKSVSYPSEMIQLIRAAKPKPDPYYENEILIVEFADLKACLEEICKHVKAKTIEAEAMSKRLMRIEKKYTDPSEKLIKGFIDDNEIRELILRDLNENKNHFINGFLELLSRALDSLWVKARETGGFPVYNRYLNVLLDIIENVDFTTIPPALVQTICYRLDRVGYYMGPGYGEANAAYKTWRKRGPELHLNTINELTNISKANPNYHNLRKLLRLIIPESKQ